jgi:hypothetical protein
VRDVDRVDPDLAQRAVGVDAGVGELDLLTDQRGELVAAEVLAGPAVDDVVDVYSPGSDAPDEGRNDDDWARPRMGTLAITPVRARGSVAEWQS